MKTRSYANIESCMSKINKILSIVMLLGIIMSIFTACFSWNGKQNENQLAEEKCKEILEAISSEDRDKLTSLFSEQALADADSLDDGIEYVFGIFKGDIQSVEQSHIVTEEKFGTVNSKMVDAYYDIVTSEDVYSIYFSYWYENKEKPEMVGVYRIKLVTKATRKNTPNFKWGEVTSPSGIYSPKWDAQ